MCHQTVTCTQQPEPTLADPPAGQVRSARLVVAAWLLAGVALLAGLNGAAVQNRREARVLETAREMLGADLIHWLRPRANGQLRLQKPPLGYWLSAWSFKVLGVNEGAGRLPSAVASWLTLGLVYGMGRRLLGQRAGLLAAGALLGSHLFYRHASSAESDALVMLFVTAACCWWWRACEDEGLSRRYRRLLWHGGGVVVGLAALSKGAPALLPLVFVLLYGVCQRRWAGLLQFLRSGCLLTACLIGLPWFVWLTYGAPAVMQREVLTTLHGYDHEERWYFYFPQIIRAMLPFSAMAVLGVLGCARHILDRRCMGLLIWAVSILAALSLMGNKQPHYLLPLLPVMALLAGWALDQAMNPGGGLGWVARAAAVGSLLAALLLAPAHIYFSSRHEMVIRAGSVFCLCIGLAALAAVLAGRYWRSAASAPVYALACALLLPLVMGWWLPGRLPADARSVAAAIQKHAPSQACIFYGPQEDLMLCFALRSIIPVCSTPAELQEAIKSRSPQLVISDHEPDPAASTAHWSRVQSVAWEKRTLRLWKPTTASERP